MKRRVPPFNSGDSPPPSGNLRQPLVATTDHHPPPPPATSNHPTVSDHQSRSSDFRETDEFSTRVKSSPEAKKKLDAEIVRRSAVAAHGHDHRGAKVARAVIRVLIASLILGYLIIWIIMPTDTYRQIWRHKLRAMFNNSTFFGKQGMNLLLYMLPVLLVAGMSCMYIHLRKKVNDYNKVDSKKLDIWASWRSPVIVKRPLGIVSGIELSFLIMFITLLLWSLWTYLNNSFATITSQSATKKGEQVWQSKLDTAALKLGLVGNICLAFLFFPVARGSSVLPLFGLTSEASIKYHIWVGNIVMTLLTAHGFCYIIYWASTNQISKMLEWKKTGISNVAGELALLSGLVMWVTTIPRIRRKIFELFFYTHHLYILFIIFFILHVGISYAFIMLPGFYLFMVDRYLRFLQSKQHVRLVSARILPCETVELNFSKASGLKYRPTSILFLNVPSISKLQWHPYTVTSNSNLESEILSVVIKTEGSWSNKLYQMLSSSSVDRLEVSIEGPYGPVSTHFLRHNTLVMISGGSGITTFISIIREMIFMNTIFKSKIPKLLLICAFKSSSELTILDLLLPISASPSEIFSLELQIEAYVTREKEPSNRKFPRKIWFKPNALDVPASDILGPNGWLWLSAIISSSFVIFLFLIGALSHYYIYPIDHNTNKIFPSWLRSAMSILILCFSISITASVAVIWNKRQNAKELGQVHAMEGTSPYSLLDVADRELESLPQQSLVQATNVHYGERPDLKNILLESKGGSVGILVCGPKKMRDDVATICSSGLADNLHFESISFSW